MDNYRTAWTSKRQTVYRVNGFNCDGDFAMVFVVFFRSDAFYIRTKIDWSRCFNLARVLFYYYGAITGNRASQKRSNLSPVRSRRMQNCLCRRVCRKYGSYESMIADRYVASERKSVKQTIKTARANTNTSAETTTSPLVRPSFSPPVALLTGKTFVLRLLRAYRSYRTPRDGIVLPFPDRFPPRETPPLTGVPPTHTATAFFEDKYLSFPRREKRAKRATAVTNYAETISFDYTRPP